MCYTACSLCPWRCSVCLRAYMEHFYMLQVNKADATLIQLTNLAGEGNCESSRYCVVSYRQCLKTDRNAALTGVSLLFQKIAHSWFSEFYWQQDDTHWPFLHALETLLLVGCTPWHCWGLLPLLAVKWDFNNYPTAQGCSPT